MKILKEGIDRYLSDESNSKSSGIDGVALPSDADEVLKILQKGKPVTVYGGGTGVVGGACADGGFLLSTEKFKKIEADPLFMTVCCGAGASLKDLHREISKYGLWYPADSTEQSATIGGNIATCAWGARGYKYGSIRNFVNAITVVTPGAGVLEIRRGELKALAGKFKFAVKGREISLETADTLPKFAFKNSAGYYMGKETDLIDLFIGSEGTLGIVISAELKVLPVPFGVFSTALSFKESKDAFAFAAKMKAGSPGLCGLEYFDNNSTSILSAKYKNLMPGRHMIICEFEASSVSDEDMQMKLVEKEGFKAQETAVCGTGEKDNIISEMREALPSIINEKMRKRNLRKLSTDFSVPDAVKKEMYAVYERHLGGVEMQYAMFGHIGNNNLHVNFMPYDNNERETAAKTADAMAAEIADIGGSVAAEHGVGKLKKKYLELMYEKEEIDAMRKIKKAFDPAGILNAGNVFDIR